MLEAGYRLVRLPYYLGAYRRHPDTKTTTRLGTRGREIRRLCRRYGLGRNEEDMLLRLGLDWLQQLTLFQDPASGPVSASPSPTTAATIRSGLSKAAPNAWESA